MKALSIKQPWAWAICSLPYKFKKDIENRTWKTKYRGEFLIHAGKTFDKDGYNRLCYHLYQLGYEGKIPNQKDFEFGKIIGQAEIIDVIEKSSSEWFEGPIGFKLINQKELKEKIKYKGQLQFFNININDISLKLNFK